MIIEFCYEVITCHDIVGLGDVFTAISAYCEMNSISLALLPHAGECIVFLDVDSGNDFALVYSEHVAQSHVVG